MNIKRKLLRLSVKMARALMVIAQWMDELRAEFSYWTKAFVKFRWMKLCKWLLRIASVSATVTGAMTAVSSASSTTGIAIGAAGATATYVTTKGIPVKGYEKIKHESPKINPRTDSVNMYRKAGFLSSRTIVHKPMIQKR